MNEICPHCQHAIDEDTLTDGSPLLCPACGHSVSASHLKTTSYTPSGQRIGRFELLDELGCGGFGTVWRARDYELDRLVAIKLPYAGRLGSPQDQERFLREGRNAARLRHPNIVPVHEVARHEGLPYLVTDFVAGVNLSDFLSARRLSFRESAELVEQVADALAYAHAEKVIHRDVKPSNIMLEMPAGSGSAPGKPLVMDFGLALREGGEATLTVEGQVLGTPAYMSPEQAAGQSHRVDGRSDVYSLGVVLFQLLTGELPFRGNARMLLHQVMHDEPRNPRSLNDQAPRDLETICLKAMAKEPNRRYAGATELRDDLRRWLRGEPILARPSGRGERMWRWYKRNRLVGNLLAAVGLLLIALAVSGVGVAFRERQSAEHDRLFAEHEHQLAENERISRQLAEKAEKRAQDNAHEAAAAKQRAQTSEKEAYRRLVQMHVATGVRHVEDGDLLGALPWLSAALAEERDPARRDTHRYRLGAVLRASPRLVHLLQHPDDWVKHAEFSRDGRLILTLGNNAAKIWDFATGKEIHVLNHRASHHAAFSPDSRRVMTAGWDHVARIWDAVSGKEMLALAHGGKIQTAAFSPDGRRLLTGGDDQLARIWDLEKSPPAAIELPHNDGVRHAAFSPSGQRVVTVSHDGKARVWNAGNGAALTPVLDVTGRGLWAEFSPDEQRVAIAGTTQAVIAEATTGRLLASIRHGGSWVYLARFSPDGQRVLTSSLDMTGRLSNLGGVKLTEVKQQGAVYFAAFSPGGRRFVTCGEDMTARIWDTFTGQPITPPLRHGQVVDEGTFSSDGRFLITASRDGTARVWDLADCEAPAPRLTRRKAHFWRISPDRRTMATVEDKHTVHVWDLESGKELHPPLRHGADIQELGFDEEGRRLFTNGADGVARFWDVATGKPSGVEQRHGSGIIRVCLSPDGKRALTGGDDNKVRGWDLATGKEIGPTLPHDAAVYWCQYSRDSRIIVTASRDNKARLWDAANGQPLTPPLPHSPMERTQDDGPALSPDGQRLVTHTAGFEARIWESATGKPIGPPLKHSGGMTTLCFSPDGQRILTAGNDLKALLWDPATGQQVLSPLRHGNWIKDGVFSPDSRRLATVGLDRVARIWDVATGLPLSPPLPHPYGVDQVWFRPDGRQLVTRDRIGAIRVWDVSADDRAAEEWLALARVLTGHRLDASNAQLPLEPGELRTSWETVCARRPADFAAALATTPAWHQRQAEEAETRGQWFAAVLHWDRLLARQPDHALAHLHRGKARRTLGQYTEALEDFDWLIARGKADAEVWPERAAIYTTQREWEKAAHDYSQAIEANGDVALYWAARGRALAELGRWNEAARDFDRAIDLGRADLGAYGAQAFAYLAAGRLDDFRKARTAILRRFLRDDFTNTINIGHLFYFAPSKPEDFNVLQPHLERARASKPNACTYYHVLGPVSFRAGQHEAALKYLNEAARLHTSSGGLPADWLFLALAHHQLGHEDEARSWLKKATDYLDRVIPAKPAAAALGSSYTWTERLQFRLLRREVEERIRAKE